MSLCPIGISNNFDSLGQSWEYHTSVFSPTGRNGYSHQPYGYARDLDSFSGTDGSRSDTPDYLAASFTNSFRTPHIDRSQSSYDVMTQGEIFLRFDGTSAQDPIDEYLGSYFGKNIMPFLKKNELYNGIEPIIKNMCSDLFLYSCF